MHGDTLHCGESGPGMKNVPGQTRVSMRETGPANSTHLHHGPTFAWFSSLSSSLLQLLGLKHFDVIYIKETTPE